MFDLFCLICVCLYVFCVGYEWGYRKRTYEEIDRMTRHIGED